MAQRPAGRKREIAGAFVRMECLARGECNLGEVAFTALREEQSQLCERMPQHPKERLRNLPLVVRILRRRQCEHTGERFAKFVTLNSLDQVLKARRFGLR